jgi:hypothetical protein
MLSFRVVRPYPPDGGRIEPAGAYGCNLNSRVVFHRRCPLLIMVRPVRASPGRWGLARRLAELLAQVRLVGEAAPQRNVTQGRIGREHVLSGQFHATAHEERVR